MIINTGQRTGIPAFYSEWFANRLKDYGQYWFVTITSYGRDIEPNVPNKHQLIEDFKRLSDIVGVDSVGWRYDPVFISERYTEEYHINAFEKIASHGSTNR